MTARGGRIGKDLTRATDALVVGALATNFVSSGHLAERLAMARERAVPVMPEDRFAAALSGTTAPEPTFPVGRLAAAPDLLDLLNAFNLIQLGADAVAFSDVETVRSAQGMAAGGASPLHIVDTLLRHRAAPRGRHRLVSAPDGTPLLEWDDGLTNLQGQGVLDLTPAATLDETFEAAMLAEAEGDLATAERLYGTCASADRRDPIAPFNRANVLLRQGANRAAVLAYRQAIDRDPRFAEAHYNLALALEQLDEFGPAEAALRRALEIEPNYPDAVFNLAQLRLRLGDRVEAKHLFERFLASRPGGAWARKAKAALTALSHPDAPTG